MESAGNGWRKSDKISQPPLHELDIARRRGGHSGRGEIGRIAPAKFQAIPRSAAAALACRSALDPDEPARMAAAAGFSHSAAVGEDGALFVWGSGENGRLGTGDTTNRLAPTRVAGLPAPVRQVAAGACHTGIVTEAGDLLLSLIHI